MHKVMLAISVALVMLLFVGDAQAAKPVPSTAVMTVVVGVSSYTISGSGFAPKEPVFLSYKEPQPGAANITASDKNGKFQTTRPWSEPGKYQVTAKIIRGNGKSLLKTVALIKFDVP